MRCWIANWGNPNPAIRINHRNECRFEKVLCEGDLRIRLGGIGSQFTCWVEFVQNRLEAYPTGPSYKP